MIKTTMMSFCKWCKKSVCLYEEDKSKTEKVYHCMLCRKYVGIVTKPEK